MPAKVKSYRLIDTHCSDTGNGCLWMFQYGGKNSVLPFAIKKVLVVSGMKPDDVRGLHAHRKTTELVVAIQGGCEVEIDDGKKKSVVQVRGPKKALLLAPQTWRTLRKFEKNTIILIIADTLYTERDYIRNYDDFLQMVGKKR